MIRLLAFRLVSIACLVFLGALLVRYPLGPAVPALALAVYGLILWRKPETWLFFVPALLPVLDLSAWTGWFYVREGDFLILATAAVGYWKLAPQAPVRSGSPKSLLLVLLTASIVVSAWRGLEGMPPLDLDSFSNYQSPYNSLRVLAGFASALLLLPLVRRAPAPNDDALPRYLIAGMTAGLALCALVTIWERVAFPGITNFSSDYRATGPFSDMHTGGAALDGYLILALPFAAVAALAARKIAFVSATALIFVAGTYAMLVTFTRSTIAAYALVLAIVLFFSLRRMQSDKPRGIAWALQILAIGAIGSYLLIRVFGTGGYRALAAVMGVCAAAFFHGAVDLRIVKGARTAAIAAIMLLMMAALAAWVPKGVYVGYAAALALFVTGILWYWVGRDAVNGATVAVAALPLLAAGALLVASYWGGVAAGADTLLALAVIGCLAAYNRFVGQRLWSLNRVSILPALLGAIALGLMVPVASNSYYMKGRFDTVEKDFQGRIEHWRNGLAMVDRSWAGTLFGMGLGSFPRNYFWRNSQGEIPGIQQYRAEDGNAFLRLGAPHYPMGFGEALRVFQTVRVEPGQTYRLAFEARANAKKSLIEITVCEKWLLYRTACKAVRVPIGEGGWKSVQRDIESQSLGGFHWFGRRPVHLSMLVDAAGTYVDVDNVAFLDSAGRNLVRNGEFSAGPQFWFFSSDYHHLPWHAKNVFLHVYIEQGVLGLILFVALYGYALYEFARRARKGDALAIALLGALAGFLIVGLFDSVLDVPRITVLAYLFLFLALYAPPGSAPGPESARPAGGTGMGPGSGRGQTGRGSGRSRRSRSSSMPDPGATRAKSVSLPMGL